MWKPSMPRGVKVNTWAYIIAFHGTDNFLTNSSMVELGSALKVSVSALGSWLYLVGGLSRSFVGRTLSAARSIVSMAIKFGKLSAHCKSRWTDYGELQAMHDAASSSRCRHCNEDM